MTKQIFDPGWLTLGRLTGSNDPFFAETFGGKKCEAFFAASRTFLYLKERGDQPLSNGGKHSPVRCPERRQIAVEN